MEYDNGWEIIKFTKQKICIYIYSQKNEIYMKCVCSQKV